MPCPTRRTLLQALCTRGEAAEIKKTASLGLLCFAAASTTCSTSSSSVMATDLDGRVGLGADGEQHHVGHVRNDDLHLGPRLGRVRKAQVSLGRGTRTHARRRWSAAQLLLLLPAHRPLAERLRRAAGRCYPRPQTSASAQSSAPGCPQRPVPGAGWPPPRGPPARGRCRCGR